MNARNIFVIKRISMKPFKFNIGDKVFVEDIGRYYPSYKDMAIEMNSLYWVESEFAYGRPAKMISICEVVNRRAHPDYFNKNLYLIRFFDGRKYHDIIISEEGLKLHSKVDLKLEDIDFNDLLLKGGQND